MANEESIETETPWCKTRNLHKWNIKKAKSVIIKKSLRIHVYIGYVYMHL